MALAYAFVTEDGSHFGEADDPNIWFTEFPYVPASGPYAGQRLIVHAATWDGHPSGTRLQASERQGWVATIQVEELLAMNRALSDPRAQ